MINDLTTLQNLKEWWLQASGGKNTTQDDTIALEISGVSKVILNWLGRSSISYKTKTEVRSGIGNTQLVLKGWPVLSVNSLLIGPAGQNQQSIPSAATGQQGGWVLIPPWDFEPPGRQQILGLISYSYPRGLANITVNYNHGYAVIGETRSIPNDTTFQIVPDSPNGTVSSDVGVTYLNGTPLTPVTSTPGTGQYIPPTPLFDNGPNYYTFSSNDANQTVLLSYSFIPTELERACVELVAERLSYRGRIGQRSKSEGGQQSVSYQLTDIPDYIKLNLQPYKQTAQAN